MTGPVSTGMGMGNHLDVHKPAMYPDYLSMFIPLCVGALNTSKSWVIKATVCCILVLYPWSGCEIWSLADGLRKWKSMLSYGPLWLGKNITYL